MDGERSAQQAPVDGERIVVDLALAAGAPLAEVGGKAAGLGRLLAHGLPVPPGFCITTAAYRRAARAAGLAPLLDRLGTAGADRGALAREARERIAAVPVPAGVAAAVRAAYAAMGDGVAVAVRSSATAEDLPGASFAGQHETRLDVVGPDAVLAAVRACWASLWTDRATAYRDGHGVDQRSVDLAVVVQRMVAAEVSGVLFTANPLTGRRGEAVVDAAPGPGDAVVDGRVAPDRFVVDVAGGRVTERSHPGPGAPCLDDEHVAALAALGVRAEQLLGAPQDLEWVLAADGALRLVQSRPVTTLYPLPPAPGDGLHAYLCASLLQGLTRPMTPMGLAACLALAGDPGPGERGTPVGLRYTTAGLRLFGDVTPLLRSRAGWRLLPRLARVADARSEPVLRHLARDPRFTAARGGRAGAAAAGAAALRALGPYRRALPQVLAALVRPEPARRRGERAEQRLLRSATAAGPATPGERLELVERVLRRELLPGLFATLPAPAAGYLWLGLVRVLLRGRAAPGLLAAVLRGLPHNVTTGMDLELWRTAAAVGADPASAHALLAGDPGTLADRYAEGALPPAAQEALRGFLRRYGHRAVAEIDLGVPRWSEDPAHVLAVVANCLRLEDAEQAPERRFARAAAEAERAVAALVRAAGGPRTPRGRLVALGLRRVRATAGLREQPKHGLVLVFAQLRRELLLVGGRLAAAGRVEAAEDVFFLDLAQVRAGLGGAALQEVVAARRDEYARELRRRHVPRVLLSDGTDVEAALAARGGAAQDGDGLLRGAPASAGAVVGRARVVREPVGARLEPGEVLVAPSTDPGWTPLFLTAGGLVVEMGGAISHGAVVAREYGLPAVVGVPAATARIRTGDVVEVDGSAGTVRVLPGDGG